MELKERVALVTGGSRGIGAAIAAELARRGALVVVNYRQQARRAEELCAQIRAEGGAAEPEGADVADEEAVRAMFGRIRERHGGVQILVNNAGILEDGPAMLLSRESWERVLGVNLGGAFFCAREAIRDMISARWGRILNLTSPSGLIGRAGQVNYSASKAGLVGVTMTLARELARFGITVNALSPGVIETEMLEKLPEKIRRELQGDIPLGRTGTPEEVARAAGFLVAEAPYMTGQVLRIDGGLVMG